MIKITDTTQLRMLGESYGEGEFYYPETFLEFEKIEKVKTDAYHAMWDAVQMTYDLYETAWNDRHLFMEAGWRDRADIDTSAMPNIPREFIKFGHDDIRYLRQADPRTHAAMLTNRYSANPKDAKYVGWGLFGALQARANGQEIGNYAPEIRTSIQGRRIQSIRDRQSGGTIPLVMAITKRKIDPNKPEIMPTGYGSHQKWKVDPKTGKKVYSAQPGEGEWGAQNGVYTGFADAIEKIETKIGHPLKNRPAQKGEVGADLGPPVPKSIDPKATSYLGVTDPVTGEKLPPSAAGYKPQGVDSSTTFYDALNKWLRGMQQNPEMFNQRYLNTMVRKQLAGQRDASGRVSFGTDGRHGYIPMDPSPAPWTKNVPPTTPPNPNDPEFMKRTRADGSVYYGRTFVPDPNNPKRTVMTRAEKQPWPAEDRERLAQEYEARADELEQSDDPQTGLQWWKAVAEMPEYDYEKQIAAWKENPRTPLSDEAKFIYKGLTDVNAKIQQYRKKAAALREPNAGFKPQQVDLGRGGYAHDEDEKGKLNKRKDDDGDNVKTPITGPVQRMKLAHNYLLLPAPGEPLKLSPKMMQQVKDNLGKFGDKREQWQLQPDSGNVADGIFAQDLVTYGLEVLPDGRFRATKQKNYANFAPYKDLVYSWASEKQGQVEFYYVPQDNEVDMPVYSPGVVDSRRGNNPSIMGGIQSAPDGSPEVAPIRDKDMRDYAMYGKVTPEVIKKLGEIASGKEWEGWERAMLDAVKGGVATGIKDLKERLGSQGDDRLGDWLVAEYGSFINDAVMYCMFNLGNSKALEFKTDALSRLNMQYIKRMFKPGLYAAVKSFDKWYLDKRNYNTLAQSLQAAGKPVPPQKSVEQMGMQEFWNVLQTVSQYLYDEASDAYATMFQVKMKPKHVKGDVLQGAVASQNWKLPGSTYKQYVQQMIKNGVPEDEADNAVQQMIANGELPELPSAQEIPFNPLTDKDGKARMNDPRGHRFGGNGHEFNLINVNPGVMMELLKEARRNYWWFAAKDMVLKIWASEFKRKGKEKTNAGGGEAASGEGQEVSTFDKAVAAASSEIKGGADAAQVLASMRTRAGYGDQGKYTNDIPNANILRAQIVAEITGKRQEFEAYRAKAMKEGSLDNIMGMTRAKYETMRAERYGEAYESLKAEARRQGIRPRDAEAFILAHLEDKIKELMSHDIAGNTEAIQAAIDSKDNPESRAAHKDKLINQQPEFGAQSVMKHIADRRKNDLNDPGLTKRAYGILQMDPDQLQKFQQEMKDIIEDDDDDYAEAYKDIITYHGLDFLMKNADKMDDQQRAKTMAFLRVADNYGLHDLSGFGMELLSGGEREAA